MWRGVRVIVIVGGSDDNSSSLAAEAKGNSSLRSLSGSEKVTS